MWSAMPIHKEKGKARTAGLSIPNRKLTGEDVTNPAISLSVGI